MDENTSCEPKVTKHRGVLNSMNELDGAIENLRSLVAKLGGNTEPGGSKEVDPCGEISLAQFLSSSKERIAERAEKINAEVKKLDGMLL